MQTALCETLTYLLESADDATVVRGTLSETMLAVAGVKPVAARSGTLESAGNREAFLGGTTGQPVSSGAITEVQPAFRGHAGIRRWWWRWHRKGADVPVSSDAPPRRRGRPKWRVLGAVAILGFAAIGIFAFAKRPAARADATVTASQPKPEPTVLPAVAVPETISSDLVPPAATEPPVLDAPRPAISASARPKGGAPKPRSTTTTTATTPRLNCNPPFSVQDGIQIHKPGCP